MDLESNFSKTFTAFCQIEGGAKNEIPQEDVEESSERDGEDDKATRIGGSSVFSSLPVVFPDKARKVCDCWLCKTKANAK